ncbi:MAG: exosome complex RNA-binding protein Csl4 [Caldisphaera sp.]
MSFSLKNDIVVPGEIVAQQEEFVEGDGVYIDQETGFLRSSLLGKIAIDLNNKTVSVNSHKKIKIPKKNSIVLCSVSSVKENIIFVDIFGVIVLYPRPKWEHEFSSPLSGAILSNQIGVDKYNDLMDVVKPGDIILAKVISSTNPFNLSLKGPQFGVIYSMCSKCGEIMAPINNDQLKCPKCGNVEKRKISNLATSKLLKIGMKKTIMIPP